MLKIRALKPDDIQEIKELHERYYSQFRFPDFLEDFIVAFVIEDENDEIIMAGGVEQLAETVLVTNQEKSRVKIGRALVEAQQISEYICNKFGIKELLAFVDDDEYAEHLIRHGFSPRSRALSLKVRNG